MYLSLNKFILKETNLWKSSVLSKGRSSTTWVDYNPGALQAPVFPHELIRLLLAVTERENETMPEAATLIIITFTSKSISQ